MNYSVKSLLLIALICTTPLAQAMGGNKTMDQSVRGIISLAGLAFTGSLVKFVSNNKKAATIFGKVGVESKEAALVLGTMGGFFSLSSSVPAVLPYGWLVPVTWLSLRAATSSWGCKLVSNIPVVGEHLMGKETMSDFETLKDGDGISVEGVSKRSRARAALFAPLFVAVGLYVPLKHLLSVKFNYPDCMINVTGRGIDVVTQFLVGTKQPA